MSIHDFKVSETIIFNHKNAERMPANLLAAPDGAGLVSLGSPWDYDKRQAVRRMYNWEGTD